MKPVKREIWLICRGNQYNTPMFKACTKCKIERSLTEFRKDVRGKLGVKSRCNKCLSQVSKMWRQQHREQDLAGKKAWNLANKEAHNKATYAWRDQNRERHLAYVAQWQRNKKAIDPQFKLLSNVRSLLYNHLTRRDLVKHERLEAYLGCTFCEFRQYIESQFDSIMSWSNYGAYWSIDHICPCDQAKTENEMQKLQHYSNTRPMKTHGTDGNYSKGNKKTPEAELLCQRLLGRDWIA